MTERAPRVGLVLGAGGVAGGAFHAGVLAALHDATGWDPRAATVIVGTSAGSITGAALRAGISAADALARAENRPPSAEGARLMQGVGTAAALPPLVASRRRLDPAAAVSTLARVAAKPLASRPLAILAGLVPDGSVSTDIISEGISTIFSDRWPDAPLWICAVRQADGRRVVFGRDERRPPLPHVVAASCAIPGFFQPVIINDDRYIDGGVHSPTNADVVHKLDPRLDLVLVSSPMSITGRGVRIAMDQVARRWAGGLLDVEVRRLRRARMSVVGFQPTPEDAQVMGINAMDPTRRATIARQAYESTLRRLDRADTREQLAALSARTSSR